MEHGLGVIPNQTEIERAYSILLHDSPCAPRTEDLAIFSQWSRFDPRLAEIWVRYLAQKWCTTNPISLRDAIESQPWPGAIAPLLEFVKKLFPTDKSQLPRVFGHWSKIITDGMPKGNKEQFFIGLRQLGGIAMIEDAHYSLQEYKKWGYLSRENLISKQKVALLSVETRYEILKSILKSTRLIRTENYWQAIGKCVSRRQAERDLKKCPHLRSVGKTKGRYFSKVN